MTELKRTAADVEEAVRLYGSFSADAILDPTSQIFKIPEGLIGYRQEGKVAIVFGDPVCDAKDRPLVATLFEEEMRGKGVETLTLSASQPYADWACSHLYSGRLEFGEELILDPLDDVKMRTGRSASLVRRKVRHAEKEGVSVIEYLGSNPTLEKAMQEVGTQWVRGRSDPHISSIELFRERNQKRWFYALQEGKVIGVIALSPLLAKNGWLMNHLMVTAQAPHGTPEMLVTTALDTLALLPTRHVTVGAVPYPTLKEISGFSPLFTFLARLGFVALKHRFRLSGRKKFWEKFHPVSEPLYLLFSSNTFSLTTVQGLLKTLKG